MENFLILALGALFMLGLIIFMCHGDDKITIVGAEEESEETVTEEITTEEKQEE